jgi:1-acyl-sn-glycerol-3-phosphate acyltransferase
MGWKIENNFPKDIKKYIIIAAPHTSSMDFPIGIFSKFIQGVDIKFIGKHTLFRPPFGFIFRALGGTPVDRRKATNMVQAIIDIFNEKEEFVFALSPEGTRKRTEKWKTGFYHVAKGANVPIVMAAIDFGNKKVIIDKPYYLTDNQKTDFEVFHNFFKDIEAKNPDQFESDFHKNL